MYFSFFRVFYFLFFIKKFQFESGEMRRRGRETQWLAKDQKKKERAASNLLESGKATGPSNIALFESGFLIPSSPIKS